MPPRGRPLDLDIEAARRIVRGFDASVDPISVARLAGGTADVFRIDLARCDPVVLKAYDDEPVWAPRKEALVAGWIAGRVGVAVPRWLRIDERRTLLPVRYALMTRLPGEPVRNLIAADNIASLYHSMGALLRRLHAVRLDAYGAIGADGVMAPQSENEASMLSAFEAVFRRFRDRSGETDLTGRLESQAHSRFALLAASAWPALCHDDFHQGNLLAARDAAGELRITGLVDFANARAADPLFDLAKALFCATHEDGRSRSPLLAGYGPVDHPDASETLWLYTLFHRMSMWSWLVGLGDDPGSSGPRGLLRDLDEMSRQGRSL
jgi:aminoglycoside phosphotransferase (APT) family kinase protein